jgi:hypothetical protein
MTGGGPVLEEKARQLAKALLLAEAARMRVEKLRSDRMHTDDLIVASLLESIAHKLVTT